MDGDAALEVAAVFDTNASAYHVAGERALGADIHAVRSGNIAPNTAQHHNFSGSDGGSNLTVVAYSYMAAGKVDGPRHSHR